MATCKYCGAWVAGKALTCGRCIRDPRLRNKSLYNIVKRMKIKID